MQRVSLQKTWRSFSRLRFGVIVLSALLLSILLGTLFPHAPQQGASAAWWLAIRRRYGPLYGLLRSLGFFDLYRSLWFRALLGLLLLSTVACFLRRVWPLCRLVFQPRAGLPAERFERATLRANVSFASSSAAERALRASLRQRRYYVQTEWRAGSGEASLRQGHMRADRHRLARLGTLLTHVGLITLLFGAAWSSLRAWREPAVTVGSAAVTPVGHGSGVGLVCEQFTIQRYEDGTPRDYRAQLALIDENGAVLNQGPVRVNHPMTHAGVGYYLQGYRMPSSAGESTDETKECEVTLMAVYDPGFGPLLVAGLCLLCGVTLTFHLPHRRMWARVQADGETTIIGSTAWDRERFARQFDQLVAELRAAAEHS